MKTKVFSAFIALILCATVEATAQTCQYITLESGNYAVQTNQILTLVGYDWNSRPTITGYFPDGTQTRISPIAFQNAGISTSYPTTGAGGICFSYAPASFYTSTPLATQIFTGLTNISINAASATFAITTPAVANVISNYIPADAIVIPASASGNVQIILESSPDLVNWTAADPGTYGASAGTNRFFRVRAQVN